VVTPYGEKLGQYIYTSLFSRKAAATSEKKHQTHNKNKQTKEKTKVWLKFVLPLLRYKIFSRGLFFLAHPVEMEMILHTGEQGRLLMGGLGDGSPTISKMGGFATKGLH